MGIQRDAPDDAKILTKGTSSSRSTNVFYPYFPTCQFFYQRKCYKYLSLMKVWKKYRIEKAVVTDEPKKHSI